jgi:hypothetical protein
MQCNPRSKVWNLLDLLQCGTSSTINASNLLQDGCLLKTGHETMKSLLKRLVASPKVDNTSSKPLALFVMKITRVVKNSLV